MTYAWKLLLCAAFLPSALLAAQEFTGNVADTTRAEVIRATVTAHNLDTGVDTSTVTTATGNYTIPYLIPGHYSISVKAPGFESGLHTGIVLQVGQTSTVNFSLKVGSATETVTVNANPLLDIGKADTGEVVENTRVSELPLDGRDPGMLSILSAGAIWTGSLQWQRPFDDTQQGLAVNGGQAGNIELMMDGVPNNVSPINNNEASRIAYVAPVDSVQEFKIITNPYDAQYGLMAGAVEDVTLKSGTNKLHGDVYEYARRTYLDADTWQNDWFISRATPGTDVSAFVTPPMKWDQYGAELDGPIFVPKLYDGRKKSFFTLQYENFHEIEPNTITESVPGPGWANGDFSNLVYWTGSAYAPVSLLDPMSISQNANGTWVRVPFGPNDTLNPTSAPNIIPQSRISPMAQKIISLYPAPNTTTTNGSNPFVNNYTVTGPDIDKYRNVLAKWDWNLSPKDRFSLHYGYWEREEVRSYDGFTGPEQQGNLPYGERSHTFTLEETHVSTPHLFLDFRANASVRADYSYNGPSFNPTNLGWSASQTAAMGLAAASEFPYLQISEFANMGTDSNGQKVSNSLSMLPSVTWVKGKHTIHSGLDMRLWQVGNDVIGGGNYFYIDRTWTQTNCGSCGSWDIASGNSIASLLLGNPTDGGDSINVKTYWSSHYLAPFFQDDWKVTHKLTMNLGLRWDFVEPETERHNLANGGFDSTAVNPINSQINIPGYSQILGGVTFLGTNGHSRSAYPLTKTDIQPRVGFAYALDSKTVLRGGFGESVRSPQNSLNNVGYSSYTNYQPYDNVHPAWVYPNTANPISNPYPSVVQPTGNSLGMQTDLGQGPWTINSHYILPTFWNYSLGVERQFLKNDLVNISYVGSRLFNGDTSDNINHESATAMAPCNPENGGRYETCNNDNVVNPFVGISAFNGSGYYSSSTINGLNLTRPFPQFTDMTMFQENYFRTWYNSIQVTGLHKVSNSLTVHGTWTWSKLMDAGGFKDEVYRLPYRQLDGYDYTHRITFSGVYLLPIGRGHMFLPNANRIVDSVIDGWELASLYIYQSGAPWSIPSGINQIGNAYTTPHIQKDNGFIRLAAACGEQYQENSSGVYQLAQLPYDYDGSCPQGADFMEVPSYAPALNKVYTGIRLPRTHQLDANLSRNFTLMENLKLQVRLESFNVLNHPLWSENPEGNLYDSNFGMIEKGAWGQSNVPRQMQLSAKVSW
jgi:hypothetical protein